jgi:tripartite-type tricarboxylate transporter receptor subunit TctC
MKFLCGVVLALALLASPSRADEAWPTAPVKVIVPFAPGGIVDVMARLVAERMGQGLGRNFVVENKPGANGGLGVQALAAAPPDGQTLLFTTSSTELINPWLYPKNLGYDPQKLAHVTVIYDSSIALCVAKETPVENLAQLVAFAKEKPQGLTFGSWGNGSSGHLFGELIKLKSGIRLDHVAYRGEVSALGDVVQRSLDMTWASPNGARNFRQSSGVRILGVTGRNRSPGIPEVPTFAEQGMGDFSLGLYGVAYVPAGTPRAVIDKIQREIRAVITAPEVKERFAGMGMIPVGNTPEEFKTLFQAEAATWKQIVDASGVKLE